jgi:hypothetical protein
MIRIYATENATQRGQKSNAMAGSVAAALKKVAMERMTTPDVRSGRGHDKGIGQPAVMDKLDGIPGITKNSVGEQIAILKSSGNYIRIMDEVAEHIETECRRVEEEARLAEEEARRLAEEEAAAEEEAKLREEEAKKAKDARDRKAAEKAAADAKAREKAAAVRAHDAAVKAEGEKRVLETAIAMAEKAALDAQKAKDDPRLDKTFDYENVAKWLHNDNQIRAFRKWATGAGIKPYLPVSSQHLIAKELAVHAAKHKLEISAAYINTRATEMLSTAQVQAKKQNKRKLEQQAWEDKLAHWVDEFGRHCRGLLRAGTEISALMKSRPKDARVSIPGPLKTHMREAKDVLVGLYKNLYGE